MKLSVNVVFNYQNGSASDYKSLHLYELGIESEVTLDLRLIGIEVVKLDYVPKLIIVVRMNNNSRNFQTGKDGWYFIFAEIYLIDKVKLKRNPRIEFRTIVWRGNIINVAVKEKDVIYINNSHISILVDSFLADYLEINPK